jgi:hypothetical protein
MRYSLLAFSQRGKITNRRLGAQFQVARVAHAQASSLGLHKQRCHRHPPHSTFYFMEIGKKRRVECV